MNDLTVRVIMKDGSEDIVNPLVSITPHENGFQITNEEGGYAYLYRFSEVDKIYIEEMKVKNKI